MFEIKDHTFIANRLKSCWYDAGKLIVIEFLSRHTVSTILKWKVIQCTWIMDAMQCMECDIKYKHENFDGFYVPILDSVSYWRIETSTSMLEIPHFFSYSSSTTVNKYSICLMARDRSEEYPYASIVICYNTCSNH